MSFDLSKWYTNQWLPSRSAKLWTYFTFVILAIAGFTIVSDFGVGFDEFVNRRNGSVSYNYVKEIIGEYFKISLKQYDLGNINKVADLNLYQDRDYGVAFDLPAYAIERFFNIESPHWQHILRHGLTYLLFLAGCIAVYKTILFRYKNFRLAVLSVIIFIVSPRIFGDAFHNSKDIAFMSAYSIATYYMIQFFFTGFILRTSLYFAAATAFAINLRIVGIIFPIAATIIFVLYLFGRRNRSEIINYMIYIIACMILTVALWPWLWANPLENFVTAFVNMSRFRWDGWVLYLGDFYPVRQLPWHYLLVWIAISTPILYVLLFIIGTGIALKSVCTGFIRQQQNVFISQDLIVLGLFFGPLLLVLTSKPVIYDGWRQFYFIYPAFVYLVIRALTLDFLNGFLNRAYYLCITVLGLATISSTILWMTRAHPYQSTYFNSIVPITGQQLFEVDYWGLSNIELLRYLVKHQPEGMISVWGLGITSLGQAIPMLQSIDQTRIQIASDVSDATYVLTNYRLLDPNQRAIFNDITTEWNNIFDIKVDDRIIASIFIRKTR